MSGVIDGHQWLRDRVEHLESLLTDNLSTNQREAVEAELARVREELGRSRRRRRWAFLWGGRTGR